MTLPSPGRLAHFTFIKNSLLPVSFILRKAKASGNQVSKSTPSLESVSTCSLGLVSFSFHRPSLDLVLACSSPQTTVYPKTVYGLAAKQE